MNTNAFKNLIPVLFLLPFFMVSCDRDIDPRLELDENWLINNYLDIDLDNLPNFANPTLPPFYNGPNVQGVDNTPNDNPTTDAGATLGRVLFYDKQLSINGTIACASCHKQSNGFTDAEVLSIGFEGGLTGAHSMRLANARYYGGDNMFWDKRAATLEEQTTMPIQDGTEMGFTAAMGGMDSLITRMRRLPYYAVLFARAFNTPEITEDHIQKALAQFVRSMVSTGSKFDEGYAQVFNPGQPGAGLNNPFPNFTAEENQGKNLFINPPQAGGLGCAGCHQPPTFSLNANSLSNGLDQGETTIFKSPSLKNTSMTGPYMHDGRFSTLQQGHGALFKRSSRNGPALDQRLRTPNGQPLRLNLNQQQIDAVIAFLGTLIR
ncbi:MAG: cytochrome c peroxidase [Saprospiraceae bacterium]